MPRQVSLAFLSPSPPGSCSVPQFLVVCGDHIIRSNIIEHHAKFSLTLASISHEVEVPGTFLRNQLWATAERRAACTGVEIQYRTLPWSLWQGERQEHLLHQGVWGPLKHFADQLGLISFYFFLILLLAAKCIRNNEGFHVFRYSFRFGRNNFMRTFAWQLDAIRYLFLVWNACKQFNIVLLRYVPSRSHKL